MPDYMVEVDSEDTYLKWMCNYLTISDAFDETFKTCQDDRIISIKLLKEKGNQDE